jgi:hypothetical protein
MMNETDEAAKAPTRLPMSYVVLGGLVFGVTMGAFLGVMTGSWYYGFHGGVFSGFAFGWGIKRFVQVATSTTYLELDGREAGFEEGEDVVHQGPANHFKGIESVGGKLFLTSRRLRFRSHKLNVQTHDESYPLQDVLSVEPVRTMGIIPNGFAVLLRDGRRERFVVFSPGQWIETVRRQAEGISGSAKS